MHALLERFLRRLVLPSSVAVAFSAFTALVWYVFQSSDPDWMY